MSFVVIALSLFFLMIRLPLRSTLFPFTALFFFFFNDTATTEIYTLSLHDALPICQHGGLRVLAAGRIHPAAAGRGAADRKSTRLNSSHTVISYAVFCLKSEEHTSELQSHSDLVCRLLLENRRAKL